VGIGCEVRGVFIDRLRQTNGGDQVREEGDAKEGGRGGGSQVEEVVSFERRV